MQSADELARHGDRAGATAAASGSTRWPASPTPSPSRARRRCSNGKPVVGFEIARSRGAGEVDVGDGVRAALARAEARSIPTSRSPRPSTSSTRCSENYDGSMHAAVRRRGARGARGVAVPARLARHLRRRPIALPLSVIPAFVGMHLLGFTINVVTLLSLSLVVGILVDDAIVEIENIVRHLRMGKTPYQAAMEAADEIGLAVIATTFTLIAVFLPTAFMSGVAGKFFVQFGWTAAIAVFFSLVVARMLTPMMAAYMLKPLDGARSTEPRWMRDLHALGATGACSTASRRCWRRRCSSSARCR